MRGKYLLALGGSLLMGIAGVARADANPSDSDLRAELAAVRAQLNELQAAQNEAWLDQRRTEEVKTLIRDVLADADTRASLLESGVTAGHNGKHFFLASDDGGFLLEISGQIQFRHVISSQDKEPVEDPISGEFYTVIDDQNESGFEVRRAKIQFAGHIGDPRIGYAVRLAVDHGDNSADADRIILHYDIADGVRIWGGEDKGPMLREELISSSRQLAVERSYVNELFTAGYVQGVGTIIDGEATMGVPLQIMVAMTDGFRSGESGTNVLTQGAHATGSIFDDDLGDYVDLGDRPVSKEYDQDASDFAITARVDLKIAGDWSQWDDFTAWDGEEMAIFVGAALHWEVGETGDAYNNNDFIAYTIDGSLEMNGFNLYAAFVGQSTDNDGSIYDADLGDFIAVHDHDLYGAVIQGGYQLPNTDLEPFVRYEWIDFDGTTGSDYDEINIVTVGANYYLNRHAAKFTFDLVWALDAIPLDAGGLGLQADDPKSDDQFVVRAQFQLLF